MKSKSFYPNNTKDKCHFINIEDIGIWNFKIRKKKKNHWNTNPLICDSVLNIRYAWVMVPQSLWQCPTNIWSDLKFTTLDINYTKHFLDDLEFENILGATIKQNTTGLLKECNNKITTNDFMLDML